MIIKYVTSEDDIIFDDAGPCSGPPDVTVLDPTCVYRTHIELPDEFMDPDTITSRIFQHLPIDQDNSYCYYQVENTTQEQNQIAGFGATQPGIPVELLARDVFDERIVLELPGSKYFTVQDNQTIPRTGKLLVKNKSEADVPSPKKAPKKWQNIFLPAIKENDFALTPVQTNEHAYRTLLVSLLILLIGAIGAGYVLQQRNKMLQNEISNTARKALGRDAPRPLIALQDYNQEPTQKPFYPQLSYIYQSVSSPEQLKNIEWSQKQATVTLTVGKLSTAQGIKNRLNENFAVTTQTTKSVQEGYRVVIQLEQP